MEYRDFFEKVSGFLEQAEKHKRRGNNDFNPYLQMLSESDEVYLHSALISGFLDPKNNHYQGDVFLETFLECVGLKEWFGDTSNAEVHKERKRIDIHITNGNRHIIIENKIWAGDQDRQIERYIESIAKEQSRDSSDTESGEIDSNDMESNELESSESEAPQEQGASYENIAVLYLAPDERKPSEYSLGKWEIQGDYLVDKQGNQVRFKAISYKDEILKWIENSQAKVGCITHLNSALYFYKDVVQIITKTKENTMSVVKFLTENKENMQKNMEIVFEILENKDKIIESYCEAIVEKYKTDIENQGFEIIRDVEKKWRLDKKHYNLVIRPKERNKVYIAFCVRENFHSIELFCPYNEKKHNNSTNYKEYNTKIINKMKEQGMNLNWFNLDWKNEVGYNFSTFEKELQRFLDGKEQKKWNEQIEKALQNGLSELIQGADKD